ncbi:MAG TPA: NAD-dependent epimerase/dehydratase family protein [Planctomycetota bacterium]|nr:NAD-dependent epimerase/dehydratase family protein [Planctomycetota bacterium]
MRGKNAPDSLLPAQVESEEELEELMTRPTPDLTAFMKKMDSDLILLGVGGKMGPTLAKLARRAMEEAGVKHKVIGISRFSEKDLKRELNDAGVETVACDLLDENSWKNLPDAPNVIYMAGRKFGSTGDESMTWAMNTYLPALVAKRYARSRIAAFSTGNVYPLTPISLGGSRETDAPNPVGEYAMSCLGRERIFEHFSRTQKTAVVLIRLNYACDLRYGILLDVAQKVHAGKPVEVTQGHVNVIWQGDANAITLRALEMAGTPAARLNLSGPETVSIRSLAIRFGELFNRAPVLSGSEAPTALLNNATQCHARFGYPQVTLEQMIRATAGWVSGGLPTLNKPTHYEARDGKF